MRSFLLFPSTVNVMLNLSILKVNFNGFTGIKLNVRTEVLSHFSLFFSKRIKFTTVDAHDAHNFQHTYPNGRKPIHQNQRKFVCFPNLVLVLEIRRGSYVLVFEIQKGSQVLVFEIRRGSQVLVFEIRRGSQVLVFEIQRGSQVLVFEIWRGSQILGLSF